jgi:hypothetical protein
MCSFIPYPSICLEQNGQHLIAPLTVNFAQSPGRGIGLAKASSLPMLCTGKEGFPGGKGGANVGSLGNGAKANRGQR